MISRVIQGLLSRCRRLGLVLRGAEIAGPAWLRAIEVPRHARRIALAEGVALDRGVTLLVSGDAHGAPAIRLGRQVYVNRHTILDASESIVIGDNCMIGPFCYITDHDHRRDAAGQLGGGALVAKPVVLEARCWIGAHVSILKGVTIGAGATVGAGSVVTHDVPAGATVVGNPARMLRPGESISR